MELRSPVAAFRTILIAVCAVLSSVPGAQHIALFPLAGLAVMMWVLLHLRISNVQLTRAAYGEAAIAGVAIACTGGTESPLLPYLLAPGLALGVSSGPRAVLRGTVIAATALTGVHYWVAPGDDLQDFVVTEGQWLLLAAGVGLVATWARALASAAPSVTPGYADVRDLLERVRTVTRGLATGLDAGAAAEALLDEASRLAPSQRSGVLVQTGSGGALVPLAVRGVRRVPWRAPLTEAGPLATAWETERPVVDRRKPDRTGRRQGGALAVVPLLGSSAPFGLVVLEARDPAAFSDDELAAVTDAARSAAPRLETSLLFDEVRAMASSEERNRLAREMHDGVAQELAFLGYRLDSVRSRAAELDPELGAALAELRGEMTDLISNLRLSITDLRTSVTTDRGLGAALGSYIRAAGTGRRLTVHLSLQESPFRLPAEREVALFRIAQLVTQDVRESGEAKNLWVTLRVDPPSAHLRVEHDGGFDESRHDVAPLAAVIEGQGGAVQVRPRPGGGVKVDANFGGEGDGDPGPAG